MQSIMNIKTELKVMHACELGAVGVYRGHKCVARYFFRSNLAELDSMRFHEKSHAEIFKNELSKRDSRTCYAVQLFFWGGLFYGVFIGLFGLKSIGTSTSTIESIVVHELDKVLEKLDVRSSLYTTIKEVQLEELEHNDSGKELAGENFWLSGFISRIAKVGAYSAKNLASIL
ncbi:demethoxyubiquinone hydroxylase family protein [Pseudoalteromonas spongiae]|uniref:Demethoxyubiquinone hydroxylase family protein n=1 Tax=Pseudoalteromonas spongiae TaxID=298657 RepID=A0ABU8ETD7_9GAMM